MSNLCRTGWMLAICAVAAADIVYVRHEKNRLVQWVFIFLALALFVCAVAIVIVE